MQIVQVTPVLMDPSRERGLRALGLLSAAVLAALTVMLADCSGAYSQTEQPVAGTMFFVISGDGGASSPLPASTGVYQFNSFYFNCSQNPGNQLLLKVVTGPDTGLVLGLPNLSGTFYSGGGPVKFYLRPMDEVQVVGDSGNGCTTSLYGEIVPGTLQTLL
jgi:hypothetical protein